MILAPNWGIFLQGRFSSVCNNARQNLSWSHDIDGQRVGDVLTAMFFVGTVFNTLRPVSHQWTKERIYLIMFTGPSLRPRLMKCAVKTIQRYLGIVFTAHFYLRMILRYVTNHSKIACLIQYVNTYLEMTVDIDAAVSQWRTYFTESYSKELLMRRSCSSDIWYKKAGLLNHEIFLRLKKSTVKLNSWSLYDGSEKHSGPLYCELNSWKFAAHDILVPTNYDIINM